MYLIEKYELKYKKLELTNIKKFEFDLDLSNHELILIQIYK